MFEFDAKFQIPYFPHHLGMNYYVNFLGHLVSNIFQIKWRFGTHGNWKNQNPISYQLNSTANWAHFARFCDKLAGLAVLFSW